MGVFGPTEVTEPSPSDCGAELWHVMLPHFRVIREVRAEAGLIEKEIV
jgi:hypothetical protein